MSVQQNLATGHRPPPVTFPILALLFAFTALKGWGYTLAVPPDFSTPPELLERLFKGTLLVLTTAAVHALFTGAPWLMRLLGAWCAVLVGWLIAQLVADEGLASVGEIEFWFFLLMYLAVKGGIYLIPVAYVHSQLKKSAAA